MSRIISRAAKVLLRIVWFGAMSLAAIVRVLIQVLLSVLRFAGRALPSAVFAAPPAYFVLYALEKISHSSTLNTLFVNYPPSYVLWILIAGGVLLLFNLMVGFVDVDTINRMNSRRATKGLWSSMKCCRVLSPWAFLFVSPSYSSKMMEREQREIPRAVR